MVPFRFRKDLSGQEDIKHQRAATVYFVCLPMIFYSTQTLDSILSWPRKNKYNTDNVNNVIVCELVFSADQQTDIKQVIVRSESNTRMIIALVNNNLSMLPRLTGSWADNLVMLDQQNTYLMSKFAVTLADNSPPWNTVYSTAGVPSCTPWRTFYYRISLNIISNCIFRPLKWSKHSRDFAPHK